MQLFRAFSHSFPLQPSEKEIVRHILNRIQHTPDFLDFLGEKYEVLKETPAKPDCLLPRVWNLLKRKAIPCRDRYSRALAVYFSLLEKE